MARTPRARAPAGTPQAGKPQAGKPQAGKPQAGKPRSGKPRASKPRAGKPQGGSAGDAPGRDVAVRMYRVGLGDCFLLRFREGGRFSHVLIDCGSLGRSREDVGVTTDAVGASLRDLTGGRLDLVVSTHEHADHLSGFRGEDNPFEGFAFGEVWMSWCEKPDDPQSERLRTRKAAVAKALQASVARLAAAGQRRRLAAIDEVLEFGALDAATVAGGRIGWTGRALQFIRDKAGANLRYLEPGDGPRAIPGVPGVRAYVLGPPREEALLNRLDEKGATYGLAFGSADRAASVALAKYLKPELDGAEEREFEAELPFDADHPLRVPTARVAPTAGGPPGPGGREAGEDGGLDAWLRARLPGGDDDPDLIEDVREAVALVGGLRGRYYGDGKDPEVLERQIEEDWLDSPEALALKLDNATNNTSLALAIELPDGRVLLFPADAQVGNWQSWAGLAWRGQGRDGGDVTARDLLARTVLYKVGHHGSHNATLQAEGLELMTSGDLVAMLPVDQEFAREKKRWRRMPLDGLTKRLEERTAGRVIRADMPRAELVAKGSGGDAAWRAFVDATRTEDDRLYIEHVIPY